MYKPTRKGLGSKKQARPKVDELAGRLSQWAEEDMGLSRNKIPSNDEIKMLLGSSAGSSVWRYILAHISKPRTVQLVKKNIQLQSSDTGRERTHLHSERAELSRELTSLRLAVTQLESDLSRLNSDIASVADVKCVTEKEVLEWRRKSHVLSAHSLKCRDMVNVLSEFRKRIHHRIKSLSHQTKEKSYFAKPGDVQDGSLQLESACKRDVTVSCDSVKSLLSQLSREVGGDCEEQHRQAKEQIWNKLESLLSHYSPSELLQCLCEVTHEASDGVHANTTAVDLSRDAKMLRYHYDQSEGLKDEVTTTNLLKSVEDHLMALQVSHLHKSIECEQCLGSATTARQRLSLLQSQVDQHLSDIYSTDSEGIHLARTDSQLLLEVGGCEAALSALASVCGQLMTIREKKRQALQSLQDKRQKIDQFTRIAEEKQSQIQSLVKANSTSWSTLQKQQNELVLYIRGKVLHHEAQLLCLTTGLHDLVNFELQRFSRLSLARMMRTPGCLRSSVCDLTIHRLCNGHPNGLPHWAELVEMVGVASYHSTECLASRLCFLTEKVGDLRKLVNKKEKALEEVKSCSSNTLTARGVLLASKRCDHQQVEVGVPALQKSLSTASQGLAKCSAVQLALEQWWEQPAQLCGHWITYEGMNLEKWLEQWRVLSSKLH